MAKLAKIVLKSVRDHGPGMQNVYFFPVSVRKSKTSLANKLSIKIRQ